MSSSRQRLAALIEPMLPEAWRKRIVAETVANIGTLAGPAVFIDYTSITHEGAPASFMLDGFEVALVSNLTDYGKAEDVLDPAVRTFIRGLDASDQIVWTGAIKRNISNYLAWVVTVQLPVNAHQE